jgi:hypothetical protein
MWWIALIAFGFFFLYFGLTQASFSVRQQAWPTVSATILEARLLDTSDPAASTTPELKLLGAYQVAGEIYRSSLYTQRLRKYDEIPERYRRGAQLLIYYDPADPSVAVLEPTSFLQSLPWIAAGLVLVFIGGWAIISDVRQYQDMRMRTNAIQVASHSLIQMKEAVEEMQGVQSESPNEDLDPVIAELQTRHADHQRTLKNLKPKE